jgi:hypothetical protein
MDDFLSARQVSRLFDVSAQAVSAWRTAGLLVPVGVFGGSNVYLRSDVERFTPPGRAKRAKRASQRRALAA